jgi:hypothetical protein
MTSPHFLLRAYPKSGDRIPDSPWIPCDPRIPGFVAFAPHPGTNIDDSYDSQRMSLLRCYRNDRKAFYTISFSNREDSSQRNYGLRSAALSPDTKEKARRVRELEKDWKEWLGVSQRDMDHPSLTLFDIYFGGRWFNMEVINLINRRDLFPKVVSVIQPAKAEPEPRVIEIVEGPTSPKSKTHVFRDESDDSEESFESTCSQPVHFPEREVFGDSWIELTLAASKEKLIDRLMEDFWILFDQIQHTGVISHGSDPTSVGPTTSSSNTAPFALNSPVRGSKRGLDNQDDPESDDDSQRRYEPPRKGSAVLDLGSSRPNFACPYRKHNPRKYSITEWRTCALTPHNSIARVKYMSSKPFPQKAITNNDLQGASLPTPSNLSMSKM